MVKRSIENTLLDTFMELADDNGDVYITNKELANKMGYKKTGGALTLGIKLLRAQNKIAHLAKYHYKVLV